MSSSEATSALVTEPAGVLAILLMVTALFFWLERRTKWRLFELLPPLMFIYATPLLLNNAGVIPRRSPVYDTLGDLALPVFICLLLLRVDVLGAVRVMGRGVLVMLLGTAGVVVGAPLAFLLVHRWLPAEAWTGYGALAASWIGGPGNMNAVARGLGTSEDQYSLALITDTLVCAVWLPILLGSKGLADRFNRWMKVDPRRLERMEKAAAAAARDEKKPTMVDYIELGVIALTVTWVSTALASWLPRLEPILTESMWRILLVTTLSLILSTTRARDIAGSHEVAMAIMYLFIAMMGALASLAGLSQAPAFLVGGFLWIFVHGAFCLFGAWLFRVDLHSVVIASAANIGGTASSPVVAAAHRESLVPVSILMALLGNAIGTYMALVAARLCYMIVA